LPTANLVAFDCNSTRESVIKAGNQVRGQEQIS
jgi:hypothetical protein